MSHVDEGTLLAIRDRSLVDADAIRHVEECPICSDALAEARDRAGEVQRLLSSLDEPPALDLEAAKADVRRELDRRREARRPRVAALPRALGRAAVLLLLASGVAYALPGSPLRGWISDLGSPEEVSTTATPAEAPLERIEVAVPAAGLRIAIASQAPGQRVEVTFTDAGAVSLSAPAGTRYSVSSEAARAEVTEGVVEVALPRGSGAIILELDGRMVLRSSVDGLEVFGDVVSRDDDGIVFSSTGR